MPEAWPEVEIVHADADLNIRRFLTLSPLHLSPETRDTLGTLPGVTASRTATGWLLSVPSPDVDVLRHVQDGEWSTDLAEIFLLAQSRTCARVLLDADAEPIPRLPIFED